MIEGENRQVMASIRIRLLWISRSDSADMPSSRHISGILFGLAFDRLVSIFRFFFCGSSYWPDMRAVPG